MNYSVNYTDTAKQDLRAIMFYIADQAQDKDIARQFINELRSKCDRLREIPNAGVLPKDHLLRSMEYRFIVHKNYLIFYKVDDGQGRVDVVAIFNAKKDYMRIKKHLV